MRRMAIGAGLAFAMFVSAAVPAAAQQRPLVTQDPEVVSAGQVLAEAGFDYGRDQSFPASGLKGNLLRLPVLGLSVGLSSFAEVQVSGGFYDRLTIGSRTSAPLSGMLDVPGTSSSDIEDLVVATKIRLVPESAGVPAIGLRLATKVPFASNESGLGLGTTDFYASLLGAKTIQSVRVVGNVGIGILGDPTRGDEKTNVLTYGISIARAMTDAVEVVGEVNGRATMGEATPAPGAESRAVVRVGARYTWGATRFDAGVLFGLTTRDPSVGVTAGLTWVFRAFDVK